MFQLSLSRMLTSHLRYVWGQSWDRSRWFQCRFLWTALGNFLQASASLYSTATTLSISKSNSLLSGIFSFVSLRRALVSGLDLDATHSMAVKQQYILCLIISIACALLSLYVEDVQDLVRRQENGVEKATSSSIARRKYLSQSNFWRPISKCYCCTK